MATERVPAVNIRTLVIEGPDGLIRFGHSVAYLTEAIASEEQIIRIDVAGLDEGRVFLAHRQGLARFTSPHLSFMKLRRSRRARASR
jgi:hypothetical protein